MNATVRGKSNLLKILQSGTESCAVVARHRFHGDKVLTKQLCLLLRNVTVNAEVTQAHFIVVSDFVDQKDDKKEMVEVGILHVLL